MMLAFAIGAALSAQLAEPFEPVTKGDYDLASEAVQKAKPERSVPVVPVPPHNLDTRNFAVDAPEAEWRIGDGGPVFLVGAMGGRRSGMPKMAHVALDWSF